ncbi:hypothetical protein PLEOSDRAFT_1105927 [Pleurotus ostreatus PC15]|uniref:Uncharacterized protein n=1 Tax=Pleurotus ostreatus (strain PC15) TaxID=1137138 RepID=A0A067NJ66_PLEO1|nr:hypothetical protein PLEOSDRAFT_1105927 [Pleurotus ostreatus PC15]
MSYTSSTDALESSSPSYWSKLTSRPTCSTSRRTTPSLPENWGEHTMFPDTPMYGAETTDETVNNTTQAAGDRFRTTLSRSIHEQTNIHSETNRARLDELQRSIAWADVMLRLKYYKARTAIRRTRKSISETICPQALHI